MSQSSENVDNKPVGYYLKHVGLLIAIINMGLAWYFLYLKSDISRENPFSAQSQVQLVKEDSFEKFFFKAMDEISKKNEKTNIESLVDQGMQQKSEAEMINSVLRFFEILSSNQTESAYLHTFSVLVLAFSFSMLAIGFSFFAMGVESAITIKGEGLDKGNVLLKATSPGAVCIILAAIIISILVVKKFPSNDNSQDNELSRALKMNALLKTFEASNFKSDSTNYLPIIDMNELDRLKNENQKNIEVTNKLIRENEAREHAYEEKIKEIQKSIDDSEKIIKNIKEDISNSIPSVANIDDELKKLLK